MTCTYCGLPTDGGRNHGTAEACVRALEAETQRLRDGVLLAHLPAGRESNACKIGRLQLSEPSNQRLR